MGLAWFLRSGRGNLTGYTCRRQTKWLSNCYSNPCVCVCEAFLLPEPDLPCGADDRGDAAGVQLQQGHLGRGVRREEGSASSLSPTHVPAAQTQLQAFRVLREETLAKRQADATAGRHTAWTHVTISTQYLNVQDNSSWHILVLKVT